MSDPPIVQVEAARTFTRDLRTLAKCKINFSGAYLEHNRTHSTINLNAFKGC